MSDLIELPGIGEKTEKLFEELGIFCIDDLLHYTPCRYMDFTRLTSVCDLEHGMTVAMYLEAKTPPRVAYSRNGLSIVTCTAFDETGKVTLSWFNQSYRAGSFSAGDKILVYGRVDARKGLQITAPSVFTTPQTIVPVYKTKKGISQALIRKCMKAALSKHTVRETLPAHMLETYDLPGIDETLTMLHFPNSDDDLSIAKRRLVFDEMLKFRLAINYIRQRRRGSVRPPYNTEGVLSELESKLPFALTEGQLSVIESIKDDLSSGSLMNRLVQGDVGSGKTAVAMYAVLAAYNNNRQSAMIAPTEILAHQHYNSLCTIVPEEKVAILTAGTRIKERRRIIEGLKSGDISVVVGTHSVLNEAVEFNDLSLVVCDEQHRFGVNQRNALKAKGETTDMLVMSATPIPRTLGLVIYGDLDISELKGMPPGRTPVKTRIVPSRKRFDMYKYIESEAKKGNQTYVVCPRIEACNDNDSDIETAVDVYDELKATLNIPIGLLHGKMRAKQKLEVVDAFKRGEIALLVSTTVIEVGIDVPTAANIVIEGADIYGLAQLHQLRGRVGRGGTSGYCFLLPTNDRDCERLRILTTTNDGFQIAHADLVMRGPGEFLGTQQSGAASSILPSLADNMEVLVLAKDAADELIKTPSPELRLLLSSALRKFGITSESDTVLN